jgi:hypothetical protein
MDRTDGRFDMALSLFESVAQAEALVEVEVGKNRSERGTGVRKDGWFGPHFMVGVQKW